MRAVSRKAAAVAMAKMLSKEHGAMVLVRLSAPKPIGWQPDGSGDLEPSDFAVWVRFAVVPLYAWKRIEEVSGEGSKRKAALLSVALFDAPIRNQDRFDWLKDGRYAEVAQYVDGFDRYEWSQQGEGYHVTDRLEKASGYVGFAGGGA